ncbi:hydrogenase maturation protease [Kribbella sp. NPDC058693]|uniref:Hydrogenase maturation protease n=1 Tax=Kribbella jiaozuonensis TaxID=2575441 RepID=A0A4U3M0F2_9ACTN|nr:hydrogenase maturation protease [Kribbella jiaozuonensis]TKK82145.1 hydrogenase maturation protease [Kribbella jiaozuonensis]
MTVLVAGLGNLFCSDDAFGVAVVAELSQRSLPDGVEVQDFGIRGIHLAYQLLEPYELVVLVDAVQRGGPPGTVYVIEAEPGAEPGPEVSMDAHDLGPDAVLSLVPRLGGTVGPVVVVGCEPAAVDAGIGLSAAVQDAVGTAAQLVVDLITGRVSGPASRPGVAEGTL